MLPFNQIKLKSKKPIPWGLAFFMILIFVLVLMIYYEK